MTCRICGALTELIIDEKFDNSYHFCSECEYIGIQDDCLISAEEEREEYDRHENTIENEGYVNFFKKFIDGALIPYINLGGSGLDFGSGPEPVMKQLLKRDYNLIVDHYDIHYQPIKVYENKIYDYILSTEVIEHILDPRSTFDLFSRHVKKGGVLAIMTLFHKKDTEHFLKWWYRRDVTHISFFTPKTFEILAEQNGFEIIHTDLVRTVTLRKK